VDAIILSVRLARFQETSSVEVVSGKNAEEELAQAAKEARARVDALGGRSDHALALKPDRADAYYWKARIYGVSQPAIRDGKFVRIPIDLQEAISNCRRATKLAPENVHYREALAQYLILDEKYDDAADVMRPVAGGQHIISVLLAGRKALPAPDKAVREPIGATGFAEMQMQGGRRFDYLNLRVQEYIINAPASEVTAFYQKRWPEFQFFESSHEKNKEVDMHLWGQLLRSPNNALQPLTNKHDFDRETKSDEASTDGISLALMEIRQRPENKQKDFNGYCPGRCILRPDSARWPSRSCTIRERDGSVACFHRLYCKKEILLPVHPVHKMRKLVLLGRQGGKGRKGGNHGIHCIHAYLSLCCRESIV
jgi:hypothetical protein